MDRNTNPQMSRELLQRISNTRADAINRDNAIKAYGSTRVNKANRRPSMYRKHIKDYRYSTVSNSGLRTNADIHNIQSQRSTTQNNTSEVFGQNRQPNGTNNPTNNTRQAFNSNNSPCFKEPPSRTYNPFS